MRVGENTYNHGTDFVGLLQNRFIRRIDINWILWCLILDPAKGDSADWYKGKLETRYAFTVELRNNGYGFKPPPKEIIPSGEEFFAGIKVVFHKLIQDAEGCDLPWYF